MISLRTVDRGDGPACAVAAHMCSAGSLHTAGLHGLQRSRGGVWQARRVSRPTSEGRCVVQRQGDASSQAQGPGTWGKGRQQGCCGSQGRTSIICTAGCQSCWRSQGQSSQRAWQGHCQKVRQVGFAAAEKRSDNWPPWQGPRCSCCKGESLPNDLCSSSTAGSRALMHVSASLFTCKPLAACPMQCFCHTAGDRCREASPRSGRCRLANCRGGAASRARPWHR